MEAGDSGEEGFPYRNNRGAGWKMSKNTIKGTGISFVGCGSNGFLSLKGTILNVPVIFLLLYQGHFLSVLTL